jgi:hypothetical protein
MALKAIKPESKEKRLKMFVFGAAGIGKTTAAIQFPKAYIIDTEKGTDYYAKTIGKSDSVVLQTNVFDEVISEVKSLLTTKHEYRTLIIDPITQLYNSVQEKWTRVFEKHAKTEKEAEVQDFGMRYWGRVKSDFKTLQRMLASLDMNIIVTSHQKDQYGNGMQKIGVTYDSMKGDDYFYDLVFRLENQKDKRVALTVKERAEPGEQKFPPEFEWSYSNFLKFYGQNIIERIAIPIAMASEEQIKEFKTLVEIVKVDEATISQWLNKADADSFEEMKSDQIQKCIDHLKTKIKGIN